MCLLHSHSPSQITHKKLTNITNTLSSSFLPKHKARFSLFLKLLLLSLSQSRQSIKLSELSNSLKFQNNIHETSIINKFHIVQSCEVLLQESLKSLQLMTTLSSYYSFILLSQSQLFRHLISFQNGFFFNHHITLSS